jgi:hypothetical protein
LKYLNIYNYYCCYLNYVCAKYHKSLSSNKQSVIHHHSNFRRLENFPTSVRYLLFCSYRSKNSVRTRYPCEHASPLSSRRTVPKQTMQQSQNSGTFIKVIKQILSKFIYIWRKYRRWIFQIEPRGKVQSMSFYWSFIHIIIIK